MMQMARANPQIGQQIMASMTLPPLASALSRDMKPQENDCASLLIAARADIDQDLRQPDGCTQLMIYCESGEVMNARWALEHGASPNAAKRNGSTPLFKEEEALAPNDHVA